MKSRLRVTGRAWLVAAILAATAACGGGDGGTQTDTEDDTSKPVDVSIPTACLSGAPCTMPGDCQQGERCNLKLSTPGCQKIYCADVFELCDPEADYTNQDALCKTGLMCVDAAKPYCCKRDCTGRECGSDGCGGSCGNCPDAQDKCEGGQCVCQPACEGVPCGDDGCGGLCGSGECRCGEDEANELGVGKPCTKGGGECKEGLECSADIHSDPLGGAYFCVKPCGDADNCGSNATCCLSAHICVLDTCAPVLGFSCEPW